MKTHDDKTNFHFVFKLFQIFSIIALFCSARSLAKEQSSFAQQLNLMRDIGWLSDDGVSNLQLKFATHYENNNKLFEDCMGYRNTIVKCNGSVKPAAGETRESKCKEQSKIEGQMKASEAKHCKLFIGAFEENLGVNASNKGKLNANVNYNRKCKTNDKGEMICSDTINGRPTP